MRTLLFILTIPLLSFGQKGYYSSSSWSIKLAKKDGKFYHMLHAHIETISTRKPTTLIYSGGKTGEFPITNTHRDRTKTRYVLDIPLGNLDSILKLDNPYMQLKIMDQNNTMVALDEIDKEAIKEFQKFKKASTATDGKSTLNNYQKYGYSGGNLTGANRDYRIASRMNCKKKKKLYDKHGVNGQKAMTGNLH